MEDDAVARTAQTQSKHTLTSIPRVGFEPTIPEFEWAKTVHNIAHTAQPL
jgi:hypothetical protein